MREEYASDSSKSEVIGLLPAAEPSSAVSRDTGEVRGESSRFEADPTADLIGAVDFTIDEMETVCGAIKKQEDSSPIRRMAEDLIDGRRVEPVELQPLLNALLRPSDFDWRQRLTAAWVLGRAPLTPAQRAAALPVLRQALNYTPRVDARTALTASFARTICPCAAIAYLIYYGSGDGGPSLPYLLAVFPLPFAAMVAYTVTAGRAASHRVQAAAAEALGRLGDAQSVEALAAVLCDTGRARRAPGRRALHKSAQQAMPAVLGAVTAVQYGTLSVETMRRLCRLLGSTDETLVLAVLRALEQVGDESTLPTVERLAQVKSRAQRGIRIGQAAQSCLAALKYRIERDRGSETLLRASSYAPTPQDELLRVSAARRDPAGQ